MEPKNKKHCATCTCQSQKLSPNGLEQLKLREGCENHVYLDSGGEPTIGVGHLLTRSERHSGKIKIDGEAVKYRNNLTDEQVLALLRQDVARFEEAICDLITTPLNQNQFDALVSFCFNVGIEAFEGSTLRKKLNKGNYASVPVQLRLWIYDNKKIIDGLIARREKEIVQWSKGR